MRDFGCEVTSDEAAEMFYAFDKDNSGHVSFDELLTALRYIGVGRFSTISHFLERILIEHIEMKNNLDYKLQIYSVCSIRIRSRT